MWGIISAILKGLFEGLIDGWLQQQKELRTESTLTKLGYDQAELERQRKEREVARRAIEIHAKPTPHDIRDITKRL